MDETLYQRVLRMGKDLAFAMWEQKDKIAVMVLLGGTVRNVDVAWGWTYRHNLFHRYHEQIGGITLDKAELPVRHFLVHQFEKVEQFCITGPNDSQAMLEEMMKNFGEFYQALNLPHRIVSVVSGALDTSAAETLRLEGLFPGSLSYVGLVSVSNCTDYVSRTLGMQYGDKKSNEEQYVHMLCSNLTLEGTLHCIIETYQRENGVEIPEALKSFMDGVTFLPFKAA